MSAEMTEPEQKPFVVDHAIVVCKGCGRERTFWFDKPILHAEDLIAWMKTIPGCLCGAATCDVKAHMKDAP